MRLLLIALLAAAEACRQAIVSGTRAWEGSLALSRAAGRLVLLYRGPMEPSIGRHFPMQLKVLGRALVVKLD